MSLRQKRICADFVGGDRVEIRFFFFFSIMKSIKTWCESFFGTRNSFHFVLLFFFFSRWLKPLHFSAFDLMQWQALRGKDTQCPYSVTFPPVGFDWPQHMHSNPCSTTNKSLSPDTTQQKVLLKELGSDIISVRPLSILVQSFSASGRLTRKNWYASRSEPRLKLRCCSPQ